MADWYQSTFVETGRSGALWVLIGFAVTYALTRWITVRIRSRKARGDAEDGPIKDVFIGGVHIHHQVWGIFLVLVVGLLEFRFRPDSPWLEVLGALFGAGAALALDEFALWLHLEDVYWSEEGRKSIDAVMVAAVVGLAVLLGTSPVGLEEGAVEEAGLVSASIAVAVHIGFVVVTLLKGKLATGLIGLPVPILATVAAFRLAKPDSFWARRRYGEAKMARATARHERHLARRERLRDLVSGGSPAHP